MRQPKLKTRREQSRRAASRRRVRRQGVVLLIVLGLMALFALVGIMFVMSASQYKKAQTVIAEGERHDDPVDVLLNMGLEQVLYGTRNRFSVIGPHSLLEDIYGTGGAVLIPALPAAVSSVGAAGVAPEGTMMYFTGLATDPTLPNRLRPMPGYYVGQVITMINGPCAGKSTRITGYAVTGGVAVLRMLPFQGMRFVSGSGWDPTTSPQAGNSCFINGREYGGTGFGYNPGTMATSGLLDFSSGGLVALLPNPRSPFYQDYLYGSGADGILGTADDTANPPPTFANESIDIPDFQNMLLAHFAGGQPGTPARIRIPSLVRPALLNYWMNSSWTPDNERRASFRPTFTEHPEFVRSITPGIGAISDPAYQSLLTVGPWDVDNDGDGVADSIWVDLGLPARGHKDGQKYKPLFAILCIDMDGRLSLNAHGSMNDPFGVDGMGVPITPVRQKYVETTSATPSPFLVAARAPGTPGTPFPAKLPVGLNVAASEISLSAYDPGTMAEPVPADYRYVLFNELEFNKLLHGDYTDLADATEYDAAGNRVAPGQRYVEGRNGEGALSTTGSFPRPGISGYDENSPIAPGGVQDGTIRGFSGNRGEIMSYFSPFDFHGIGSVGLDYRGQPIYFYMAPDGNGDRVMTATDVPYQAIDESFEIDLSLAAAQRRYSLVPTYQSTSSVDNAFGIEELEWLLRPFDVDMSGKTSRLAALCPNFAADPYRRQLATTESWHTPTISFNPTPEIRTNLDALALPTVNLTVMDLLRGKIKAADSSLALNAVDTRVQALMNPFSGPDYVEGVAPELWAGLAMNINRAFGDNLDNDGDLIVDEPGEVDALWTGSVVGSPTRAWGGAMITNPSAPPAFLNVNRTRYRMAKQLYILMMLLKPVPYLDPSPAPESLVGGDQQEYTARRLAQWAINVVDFRDADSIMTAFEFDLDPFTDSNGDGNPWDVDGWVGYNEATRAPSTDDTMNSNRMLVWGSESPELLLTETGAFHDRRVADLMTETPTAPEMAKRTDDMPDKDTTFDQPRLPQGSLFAELYCTRNPHNPVYPRELYAFNGTNWELDLNRMAPAGASGAYPVWRIVVTQSRQKSPENNDVRARLATMPDTASFQVAPYPFGQLVNKPVAAPATGPVAIDRIIWFSNTAPGAGAVDADKTYYRRAGVSGVAPGQYLIIGPRAKTWIGNTAMTTPGPPSQPGGAQLFDLSVPRISDNFPSPGAYKDTTNEIQMPAAMIIAGGVTNPETGEPAGISVSEPLFDRTVGEGRWYKTLDMLDPNKSLNTGAPTTMPDGVTTAIDRFTKPLDEPLDSVTAGAPLSPTEDNLQSTRTTANYKTLILQRLANPTIAWNPEPGQPGADNTAPANPYITVDWMPVDLTVFTSEFMGPASTDPDDATPTNMLQFRTRERGLPVMPAPPANEECNLWNPVSADPENTAAASAAGAAFATTMAHTLGYLNSTYGTPLSLTTSTAPHISLVGAPPKPFPWLTWNNRPYASNLELMQVPASGPSRLLNDFSVRRTSSNVHYGDRPAMGPGSDKPSTPYGHLLNFFYSGNLTIATTTPALAPPDYHRVFNFVDVPSRFSGTRIPLDPRLYQISSTGEAFAGEAYPFYAPDNVFSTYREPGRVNINTTSDAGHTWLGIVKGASPMDFGSRGATATPRFWDTVMVPNRRGPAGPAIPADFSHPFVPGDSYYVPLTAMHANRNFIENGLLRSDQRDPTSPLFAFQSVPGAEAPPGSPPAGYGAEANAALKGKGEFNDTDRNAYFRYQMMQKLSNSVTTRSNVYAVWITVGYFNVRDRNIDPIQYPDGLELLGERGLDTGTVERHRGFYIIDRSIPVGFERGVRHNAMDAVRLQRVIE